MKQTLDLSALDWNLSGWIPYYWKLGATAEVAAKPDAVVHVPAHVPGSVQDALRRAGELPDWNIGVDARACEWVENRHWIYETQLTAISISPQQKYILKCLGLDYSGWVYLNGLEIGTFIGTHVPHEFDLTPHLNAETNTLRIIFDLPPRWLGQLGYSWKMTEWKPRFNYTWDWEPRLVQLGIWDDLFMEIHEGFDLADIRSIGDVERSLGTLTGHGQVQAPDGSLIKIKLSKGDDLVRESMITADEFNAQGFSWTGLPVELWWPNGDGAQPLYDVSYELLDSTGVVQDTKQHQVGFVNIAWQQCEGAPEGADPWLCVINDRPVFLQGVNFPPMLSNFADATQEMYRKHLELYRDLGANTFRINACQFLEKECFYTICDELGLLVWQECPLTSSGIDNRPPSDEKSIEEMALIAQSFICRRQHHPSVLLWSGGNELQKDTVAPADLDHPMLARLGKVAAKEDPTRRYIPTSPSGRTFTTPIDQLGKGVAWDVHGEWKWGGDLAECEKYYALDDALFRSEAGSPGAASADLIRRYAGNLDVEPIDKTNPLWRNPVGWWIEADIFEVEHGRKPSSLEEYVDWSQQRQATALVIAVKSCKARFPKCGGVLLWCGHDCFPCPTNTSIIDFEGNTKLAARELSKIWKATPSSLTSV